MFDRSFGIWAERLNIDYTGMWAPTTVNNTDEYLSGLETFIDQGYDGVIIDSDKSIVPRLAEILNASDTSWISGMGFARELQGDKRIYCPAVGFDNWLTGYETANKLGSWKDETWPDVPWEKVGMICVDYSPFPDPHQRILGAEQWWVDKNPSFGEYNESMSDNPKNFFICDTATAGGSQTDAQNMVTQILSDPGEVEVWLVVSTLDDYSLGAANAAESLGITEKVCAAGYGGNSLVALLDSGKDSSWRYAFFIAQGIYCEPIINALWAFMSGQATPDTLWPEWVNAHDKGDAFNADGSVKEEHSYATLRIPGQWIEKSNYKEFLEWCDLYIYGADSDGDYGYDKVSDLNLYSSKDTVPDSYK
jgi:ABC-type sugar transport system substrate-binding protein